LRFTHSLPADAHAPARYSLRTAVTAQLPAHPEAGYMPGDALDGERRQTKFLGKGRRMFRTAQASLL
jgi:hypothetical protein